MHLAQLSTKLIFKTLLFVIAIIGVLFVFGMFPTIARAEPIDVCATYGGCAGGIEKYSTPESTDGIVLLIKDLTAIVVYVSVPIAVVFVIFGGYKMLVAQGDEKQYSNGLQTVSYAAIGLAIVILSSTIIGLLIGATNSGFSGDKPQASQSQEEAAK